MSEIKEADPEAATVPISRSTVELIQHIFSSSESAIELLNDLLHYEQIDAGSMLSLRYLSIFCILLIYLSSSIRIFLF